MAVTPTVQKTGLKNLLENQLLIFIITDISVSRLSAKSDFWVTHRTAHAFSCIQSASTKVSTTTSPFIFAKGSQILEKNFTEKNDERNINVCQTCFVSPFIRARGSCIQKKRSNIAL